MPPPKTLPALYVLDSVVKNVPTPYALYFGPKLYSIFMGAYTKVDNVTRRKMDEMLKTWKEPVPGSISTKPVFPPEYVRPIEHALIAARNAAHAANQNFQGPPVRGGRPAVPTRDTPTPPTGRPPSYQAGPHGQQPFPGPNGQLPHQIDSAAGQQPYPMRPFNIVRSTLLAPCSPKQRLTDSPGTQRNPSSCNATANGPAPSVSAAGSTGSPRRFPAGDKHRKTER